MILISEILQVKPCYTECVVRSLIHDYDADIYARDDGNNMPLHVAALKERNCTVFNGCDINIRDPSGKTLLHRVCKSGSVSLVRSLIHDYNADINARDNENNTPLHVAALHGRKEVALFLIKEFGCDINIRDTSGKTLLHRVCKSGSVSLVQSLIHDYYADINARDDGNNMPLHVAALDGKKEVVLFLIEVFGCDINIRDPSGKTLLHRVCESGSVSLVQSLMHDYKADVYARDDENNTPLHVAALNGNKEVFLIEDLVYDINVRGGNGYSLLHSACHNGHFNLTKTLCKFMSPLIVDEDGNTPLHISSIRGHNEDSVTA